VKNAIMKTAVLYAIYLALLSNASVAPTPSSEDQLNSVIYSPSQSTGSGNLSVPLRKKSVDQKRYLGRSQGDCAVAEEQSNTIIKTKESQAAGAVFISGPAVTNRDDCIAECCRVASCNTAVVKEKVLVDENVC